VLIKKPTGEVYVLNDGGEVDLDLGNYERYLNVTLSRDNNITTGKIYREVIDKEVGDCSFVVGIMTVLGSYVGRTRIMRRAHQYQDVIINAT